MNLQDQLEWLLDQMIQGEWRDAEGPDFRTLRTEGYLPDADVVIPLQWLLCTKEVPQARQAIRRMVGEMREALNGVEALLEAIDAAEEEANTAGHPDWVPFLAILEAPIL